MQLIKVQVCLYKKKKLIINLLRTSLDRQVWLQVQHHVSHFPTYEPDDFYL